MTRLKSGNLEVRKQAVLDFLNYIARRAKSDNVDQYLRNGMLKAVNELFDAGAYFLTHALGASENDFIPNINFKEFACFVPQSESYYPWVFFVVPTEVGDLNQFFDHHGRNYLISADAGRKDYAVITNLKVISVFDFSHNQIKYEVNIDALYDGLSANIENSSTKNWINLLRDFGPEKVEAFKKKRRKEVVEYVGPKVSDATPGYAKRFGHMPSFDKPVGYDGQGFRDAFVTKEMPFLTTEEVDFNGQVAKTPNRIIWGDNLSVLRATASNSVDLVYIDPPFFSGKNYNLIFGDDDEVRSFKDIWDGGLPNYLAWMNARIWEIKRVLSDQGSLVVHLDHHACHYVKVELDKIFGPENFRNEIVWHYTGGGRSKSYFSRKHDNMLWYSKTSKYTFNLDEIRVPYKETSGFAKGGITAANGKRYQPNPKGTPVDDVWDIPIINPLSHERIGYPTQKPEILIERIIKALSNPGDVVADFFSGGGTTIAVAEKLDRRWLAVDISRIAVSVARDRLSGLYESSVGIVPRSNAPTHGFRVEYQGVYERDCVRELADAQYVSFIMKCYQAIEKRTGDLVHGFKGDTAIFVSSPKRNLRKDEIEEFHTELLDNNIRNGTILAWNISKDAEKYVEDLRRGANGPSIQIIQVRLVDIDSNEFKGENVRFINKPVAVIKTVKKSGLTWIFDASASCGTNGSEIHYFQWDFDFKNRFSPSTRPSFKDQADTDGNAPSDYRRIEFSFADEGIYKVALRVFDRSGAEATHFIEIKAVRSTKKAG